MVHFQIAISMHFERNNFTNDITMVYMIIVKFQQVPITAGWIEVVWIPKLLQGFLEWPMSEMEPPDALVWCPCSLLTTYPPCHTPQLCLFSHFYHIIIEVEYLFHFTCLFSMGAILIMLSLCMFDAVDTKRCLDNATRITCVVKCWKHIYTT